MCGLVWLYLASPMWQFIYFGIKIAFFFGSFIKQCDLMTVGVELMSTFPKCYRL